MGADVLATQGARASATLIFICWAVKIETLLVTGRQHFLFRTLLETLIRNLCVTDIIYVFCDMFNIALLFDGME